MSSRCCYLFLVPTDWSDKLVSEYMDRLPSFVDDPNIQYVNMRTWYQEQFVRSGNRNAWLYDTIFGKRADTRDPFFQGYVLPPIIDNPGASIAQQALNYGKIVLCEGMTVKGLEQTENGQFSPLV